MAIVRLDHTHASPDDWSAGVVVPRNTWFHVHAGSLFLALGATAPAALDDGIILTVEHGTNSRHAIMVDAGTTVRWRRMVPKKQTILYYGIMGT